MPDSAPAPFGSSSPRSSGAIRPGSAEPESDATDGVTAGALPAVPRLSVIVPTFNERGNVERMLAGIDGALKGVPYEVIFVDDDSPDGTADTVRQIGERDPRVRCIRRVGRRGLAGACIEGMLAAQAPLVAVIDGDLQHDVNVLRTMLDRSPDADLVVASRYVDGGSADGLNRRRGAMSRTATGMARRILGIKTSDPMSGCFLIRRALVERLAPALSPNGFKILLDIMTASKEPMRVVEVPMAFAARDEGDSKLDSRTMLDFVTLLIFKVSGGAISPRFVWFSAVGGAGLVLHLLMLKGALLVGLGFAVAQSIATIGAMTSNFAMNNVFTYRDRRVSGLAMLPALLKFYLICGAGAVANVGVASWVFEGGWRWWLAGVAGSVIGAVWNFAMTSLFVWGPSK
ncbi:glycosyltransferase family 2 protein [Xanthobacter sp. 126]|uniref:glycosyltransferase n=1 Tax=Xanthobacter sp. 126 TaxID=1131814 RepID=UPI0004B45687|nr:glycosyltransferase family 2 protein [Xanthobacter sp. 126]